jgi:gluconate kinase
VAKHARCFMPSRLITTFMSMHLCLFVMSHQVLANSASIRECHFLQAEFIVDQFERVEAKDKASLSAFLLFQAVCLHSSR